MSDNRSDRGNSNRDYIPLENSISKESSSSEDAELQETEPLLPMEDSGILVNVNGDLHSAGDSVEVEGVREIERLEIRNRIPIQISSGYLGSIESSSGTDNSEESTSTESVRPGCSSQIESTCVESTYDDQLVPFIKSLINSATEEAFNCAGRDTDTVNDLQETNLPSLINSKKSQSTDSFFSSSKSDDTAKKCRDHLNLYRMTIKVTNPCETISIGDSLSLETLNNGLIRTVSDKLEYNQGDNELISVQQLQREAEYSESKKDEDPKEFSRWNFLRNLNALYPARSHTSKYDIYVNTEKQEDQAKTSKNDGVNKDSANKETNAKYYSIPRTTALSAEEKKIQNEKSIAEFVSFVNHSVKSLGSIQCTEKFHEFFGATFPYQNTLDSSNLIGKPFTSTNSPDPLISRGGTKTEKISESFNEKSFSTCSLPNQSAPRKSSLKIISKDNLNEPRNMAELFYIGDPKSDDSDRCQSSDTMDSESSKGTCYKWKGAATPDGNNNFILSQTSSEDSVDVDSEYKFQFTKDISGKEEYLRQNLTPSEEELNFQKESRRRVSFKDEQAVYSPARQSYLRNRKLDFSPKSPKPTVDVALCTDIFDETQHEIIKFRTDFTMQQKIIDEAEKTSHKLLRDLQCLWMNISDMGCLPNIAPQTILGEHNLIQQIQLCNFIVEQMNQNQDWRMSAEATGMERLQELQNANKTLKEQLDSCKIIQNCLESEINYAAKEKALLNDEVKHLSYQLAARTCKLEKSILVSPKMSPRQADETESDNAGSVSSKSHGESRVNKAVQISKLNVKKREDEFDSIMDCVRDRKGVMDALNSQIDKYQEDVRALKIQIEKTNEDKEKLYATFEALIEEKKSLTKERNHYESVLKLILNEKTNHEFNLQDLLERVMAKLSTFTSENEGKTSRFLEGALQAVQEQNAAYRNEISQLKDKISSDTENHLRIKSDLETSFQKVSERLEELKQKVEDKSELQKSQEEKLSQLHELQTIATQAKNFLDKSVEEKDVEIAKLREAYEGIYKTNLKQQRKIHELQKLNSKLSRETQEHKRNIEQLGSIINQLRHSLSDQKVQYAERVQSVNDDANQSKEHCRWLQAQVDHLNNQLCDAHGRIKAQEKDKTSLAQQVLSAEEERKVVDRKLNELKSALESDTVLRQALIERNEALQVEINRLRRIKMSSSFSPLISAMPKQEGEFGNHPSELTSISEGLSSMNSYPLSDYKPLTVGDRRKNRHPTPHCRKGNEALRIAVSLQNATGSSGNGNNTVDSNAAGAACSLSPAE